MASVDENIKRVLELIDSNNFDPANSLPDLSRDDLKNLVLMCEEEGYISYRSSKGKPLVQGYMGGGWSIAFNTFVTRPGKQFLEGFDRNVSQTTQTFNIQTVQNSALGNYNTVNNYSSEPLNDLESYVNTLSNEEDQKTGNELIETLKTEEIKPGFINKFEKFMADHPKSVDLVASFVTAIAMNAIS